MQLKQSKDIQGKPYTEYTFKTDYGSFSVSFDDDKDHYALFTVTQKGEPTDIETYFGLNKEQQTRLIEVLLTHKRHTEPPKVERDKRKLIRNALQTPDGTVLESLHRHDYRTHTDKTNGKQYMVDGGLDYIRCSINGDEKDLCLYDDEPHRVQREVLVWGSYGKNGDQPLKRIKIKDMETDHIEAVLRECKPRLVLKNCMEAELELRQNNE